MSASNFNIYNARVTFKNIPIHKLHRYRFKDEDGVVRAFKNVQGVTECLIIQTGSRIEIFVVTNIDDAQGAGLTFQTIKQIWAENANLTDWEVDHFDQTTEMYINSDVYGNLLRLACGLQSVVVGKPEIFDQVKAAAAKAKENGSAGVVLNKLFDTVIRVASNIRGETQIGQNWKSIGDIAVKLADEHVGIEKKKILIVGTGEVAARVAKSLNRKGLPFSLTSMQLERAQGFAEILGGEPVEFKEVLAHFDKYDVVFVATTADYFIIQYDSIKRQMDAKKTGTMILDISEPRAVSEDVSTMPNIKLMYRDHVAERYSKIQAEVNAKVPAVEKAIMRETPILVATMGKVHAEHKVENVFTKVEYLRERELKKALGRMGEVDEEKKKIIEELTKSVVENILAVPEGLKRPAEKPKAA